MTTEIINELKLVCNRLIPSYEYRRLIACNIIYTQRVPTRVADRELYEKMQDVITDYLDENEISYEFDEDFDELIDKLIKSINNY